MFANREAIESLVKYDSKATRSEKGYVLSLLESRPLVVSVGKAAYMLGMSRFFIYKCVKSGALKGIYGAGQNKRIAGVTVESIEAMLSNADS